MNKNTIRKLGRVDSPENRARLSNEIKRLQNKANKRINALNKYTLANRGAKSAALEYVKSELESLEIGGKFSASTAHDASTLSEELELMIGFLNAETSTIRGVKRLEKNLKSNAAKLGVELETHEDLLLFQEFLESELGQELLRFDSGKAFQAIEDAIKAFESPEKMRARYHELYEKYKEKELKIDEFFTKWTGVNPFL